MKPHSVICDTADKALHISSSAIGPSDTSSPIWTPGLLLEGSDPKRWIDDSLHSRIIEQGN